MKKNRIIRAVLTLGTFMLFIHCSIFSQTFLFKGIIKDEQTLKPIPDVNIKIAGTTEGTATDKAGRFVLKVDKIPATLEFSCVGYKDEQY